MEQTEATSQEFSNERIHCKLSYGPYCVANISVTLREKVLSDAKLESIKQIKKSVQIPGFRMGKAPSSIVEQRYSQEIEKQSKEECARIAYTDALSLSGVQNLHQKGEFSYSFKEFSPKSAVVELSFETIPSVPEISPSTFSISSVERPEITEKKVTEAIRQALFFYATWHPVTDRAIQEGDFVILDATTAEPEGTPSVVFSKTRFEVTQSSMASWMKEAIMGKKAGDSVEATSVADDDATEEEKALFQPKQVFITIQTVETATLPDLSEEILQKLGVSSEEELKKRIEKQLQDQVDNHVLDKQREEILHQLIEKYPFAVPRSLVNREIQFRAQQLSQDTEFMKHWDTMDKKEKDQMLNLVSTRAETSIRLSLLCSTLLQKIKAKLPVVKDDALSGEYSQQILTQAVDYILSHASPVEATVS